MRSTKPTYTREIKRLMFKQKVQRWKYLTAPLAKHLVGAVVLIAIAGYTVWR